MKVAAGFAALATACAGQWHSTPAETPLSRTELASRNLTVAADAAHPDLREAFSRALTSEGFALVAHPPNHEDLEVTLSVEQSIAIATLRSDGFLVDEARAPIEGNDITSAALARILAVSQGMADFVRNSGLPQQQNLGAQ